MKLTKLSEDGHKLTLRVEDVDPAYLNTLRRYMSSNVPTMAIDMVEFNHNNSILYDEMVAHRMGLIPLTTDLETYKLPEAEWNEPTGDPRVEVQLTLKVDPVKSDTVVTSGQLKSKDPKIKPVFEDIPIVKLIEGQSIELIATARLGTGDEHAKWVPAHIYYRFFPNINIKKQPSKPEAVAEKYPDLFEVKSGKLVVLDQAAINLRDRALSIEGVEVSTTPNDFILEIESWGQLAPKEIFEHALSVYDEELDAFEKLTGGIS